MNALLRLYLNDDPVTLTGNTVNTGTDKRYQDGAINLYWTDGSAVGTAFAAIVALLSGIWTNNHRGDGVVMLAQTAKPVKSKKFLETYPNQVPTPSMVAQWQICPDPHAEDPSDPSGWTWTENPIRQLMHYMLVREGVDYATKIAPTIEYFQAAADVCDAARALKAGGSEPRYRSWVSHKHTDSFASVKASILETCDGWIAPRSDGALVVYAGEYIAPTVTIGPDEIVSFEWAGVGVDDDAAVNEIVCSYISADHDYNTVETEAWRDEADISARGAVLSESFEPQVPSWAQVHALAKRTMGRRNALYRGSVTTNIRGRIVRGHRYITLNLIDAGTTFYSGPAEITAITRNISTGGVTFDWVAADPNIDAWNPPTEEGSPAAKGDRVASEPVSTPEITSAMPVLAADGASAQVSVEVDAPDRDDLTWYGRWKLSSASVWNEQEYSDIDGSASVELVIGLVPVDASVDVAVAYQLGDGRVSDWSTAETVSTSTAGLAPSPNTAFNATGGSGDITGGWSNSAASNFGHSELWAGPDADFGNASQLGGDFTGAAGVAETFDESLSAGTHFVWSMAVNASGTAYSLVGPIEVTVT
jgi:hypothetical protein